MPDVREGRSIVHCLSGGSYADRPIYFLWDDQRLDIIDIINRSRDLDGEYFQVRVDDGRLFKLFYSPTEDIWRIEWL